MNVLEKEKCRKITKALINNVITSRYAKSHHGGKDLFFGMTSSSEECEDFETILTWIEDGKYSSYQKWENDILKIIQNGEKNTDEEIKYLDQISICVFRKLCDKHPMLKAKEWGEKVFKYRNQLSDLLSQPPETVFGGFSFSNGAKSNSSLSQKEIQSFLSASERLTENSQHREMINIIHKYEPKLNLKSSNICIDITVINPGTFIKLKEYVKSELKKASILYPE